MKFLDTTRETAYEPLKTNDGDDEISSEKGDQKVKLLSSRKILWQCLLLFAVVAASLLVIIFFHTTDPRVKMSISDDLCDSLAVRREWRALSDEEKKEYIDAVNCLRQRPSRLNAEQSLYDDFPYVHTHNAHDTALFLAWHRLFIHIFENALRDECSYTGHLAYWDWTLDWQDITKAPIWDDELGFGGDGSGVGQVTLNGTCVTTGPFANLTVNYLKNEVRPHCLSRGFAPSAELARYRSWISPSAVEELLRDDSYEDFNLGLEHASHNAIPRSIRGDFQVFTAPYDPVFFLHHTQLDRIWFHWQQSKQGKMQQYTGSSSGANSGEDETQASSSDKLSVGDLAPEVRVADILNTRNTMLCYEYL